MSCTNRLLDTVSDVPGQSSPSRLVVVTRESSIPPGSELVGPVYWLHLRDGSKEGGNVFSSR